METLIHEGHNVKRLREILGIKQETLAAELGINQQKMSFIEQKEKIDNELMEQVAKALHVPVEAIRNFDDKSTLSYITTLHDNNKADFNYQCTINPIEKWIETLEENRKLYERLLQSEKKKSTCL